MLSHAIKKGPWIPHHGAVAAASACACFCAGTHQCACLSSESPANPLVASCRSLSPHHRGLTRVEEGILGHPVCQPGCSPTDVGAMAVAVRRRGQAIQREALNNPAATTICRQEVHMLSIDALQAVQRSAIVWRIAALDALQYEPGCRPADAGAIFVAVCSRQHCI